LEYDDDIPDAEKQKIAMEMNLSETAFVSEGWIRGDKKLESPSDSKVVRRTLRWFTPTNEVPLCGHATVASMKCIAENNDITEIEFDSKFRGSLGAVINRVTSLITLNFPANPTEKLETENNNWIKSIVETTLGLQLSLKDIQDLQYSKSTKILLIRLKDELTERDLENVSPNFQKLLEIDTGKIVHDIIVTVKGGGGGKPDFYSRFFAPWDGIDEDPVTGLAHTVLTPYWTQEYSKDQSLQVGTLLARQHSSRGGDVHCLLQGDRVRLSGRARITVKGQLL
jgi:PhzF family phenazine biosynthesis protein